MREMVLSDEPDAVSPAGALVRLLLTSETGGLIHSTVPVGQINRAAVHHTVNEIWYILEGHGEIWRKDDHEERVTTLLPGVVVDIPVRTAFQYRNVGANPLKFICVTMPKWRGDEEASYVDGPWTATV